MRAIPILFLAFASCAGSIDTKFEDLPGTPAEYDNPTYCGKDDEPGVLRMVSGKREGGGYYAEGGGCIAEDIKTLWERGSDWKLIRWKSLKDNDVIEEEDPPEGALRAWLITYTSSGLISVNWTMKWLHSVTAGTPEKPRQIVIQFQKVTGTAYIKHWKGSFVLTRVREGLTSFAMRFELYAMAQGEDAARESVELFHGKFLTGK